MSRLIHSARGFVRMLQISTSELFCFVEGQGDSYFYSEICRHECKGSATRFTVILSRELTGHDGGKRHLIDFFLYLRRQKGLSSTFKGKSYEVIFFLDKDMDDLRRRKRRSPHVVYTKWFDVENHIFRDSDLLRAGAAATSLPQETIANSVGTPDVWRRSAAERWKDWVILCAAAALADVRCECTYATGSRINSDRIGRVDLEKKERCSRALYDASTNREDLDRIINRIKRLVNRLYLADEYDRVFKGKWYSEILASDLVERLGAQVHKRNGLAERLRACALMTLTFDNPSLEHFGSAVRSRVERLQASA